MVTLNDDPLWVMERGVGHAVVSRDAGAVIWITTACGIKLGNYRHFPEPTPARVCAACQARLREAVTLTPDGAPDMVRLYQPGPDPAPPPPPDLEVLRLALRVRRLLAERRDREPALTRDRAAADLTGAVAEACGRLFLASGRASPAADVLAAAAVVLAVVEDVFGPAAPLSAAPSPGGPPCPS